MDFYFDNCSDFYAQDVSPSSRTPDPTNYPHNINPHEPCSYCSDLYHSASNCPSWGQFCNFTCEQMNTNFSSPEFDSNSNFYNSDWSNHLDFSWQAQPLEIVLPSFRNCTILIIHSSIINLPILHPTIIQLLLHSPLWKTLSRSSSNS
jgi:hypothetical protein